MTRLLMCLCLVPACVTTDVMKSTGERNAMAWCHGMDMDCVSAQCSASDSDRDGYTSCTIRTTDGARIPIDCGYDYPVTLLGQNTGCREKTPINLTTGG